MPEHEISASGPRGPFQLQLTFDNPNESLTDDLYQTSIYEDLEDREEYKPGGYHPVHLGDTLGDDDRYRVLHKLGNGEFATVWLCRDIEARKYVAVKIITAEKSHQDCPELNVMKLSNSKDNKIENDKIAIPQNYFWINGPNGSHLCLVLLVLGPHLPNALFSIDNYGEISRKVALQVVQGLKFLHSNGLCHGDFRPAHVLLKLSNFDDLTEEELIEAFGVPFTDPVLTLSGTSPGLAAPNYLVRPINFGKVDARFFTEDICIIDFGESYDFSNPPKALGTSLAYCSPELIFDQPVGVASDIWALACTLNQIRSGAPLFGVLFGEEHELVSSFIQLLGTLPEPWLGQWDEGNYCPEPDIMDNSVEGGTLAAKLHILKTWIRPEFQVVIGGTGEEKSIVIPEDELEVFVDLLGQMFKYDPKERISAEAVQEHPWFSGKWVEDKKEGSLPNEEGRGASNEKEEDVPHKKPGN